MGQRRRLGASEAPPGSAKVVGFTVLAIGGAIGCGDEPEDEAATSTEQTATQEPNHEVAPPSNTSEGDGVRAERELVAGAERELKATGGWERWSVEKIEAAGPDDLVVYTGLYPDAEAYPAATGICTTLRNPASTRIKVDLVQVLGSNGDEVEPPACECEYGGDPSDPISVAKASASQAYVPASTAPPLDALVAVASRPA